MAKDNEKISEFLSSKEYKDICYFIDHILDPDISNSCCERLGYSIGLDIIDGKQKIRPKSVIVGGNGEFRVISYIQEGNRIAESVVCKI